MEETKRIGGIGNYYGCLEVSRKDGKYFWSIEDWDGHDWEEIPEYLYNALIKYYEGEDA